MATITHDLESYISEVITIPSDLQRVKNILSERITSLLKFYYEAEDVLLRKKIEITIKSFNYMQSALPYLPSDLTRIQAAAYLDIIYTDYNYILKEIR